MPLKRFGVSLEDNLLESLDQYVSENGFANRSQAIRFLVEKNVAEKKWQCNHIVAGTIILMYDQVKKDITSRIVNFIFSRFTIVKQQRGLPGYRRPPLSVEKASQSLRPQVRIKF